MLDQDLLVRSYRLMYHAKVMADTYEANRSICKYVHATSRGHEAIQLATAFQLRPCDWVSPYYRDESMLLGLGWSPYELMLQLLTRKDDPFTGGRSYYSHPNSYAADKPKIIHQSSATGMQAIPTTGIAQGIQYLDLLKHKKFERLGSSQMQMVAGGADVHRRINDGENTQQSLSSHDAAVVVCSLGDASLTEGEVSEALQVAVLKQLPIIYLVQDNDWGISVPSSEGRAMDAFEFAGGYKGLHRISVDGTDFQASFNCMQHVVAHVRQHRQPWMVHARVALLNHHTSGVRKEFYRSAEDLAKHIAMDPLPKCRKLV
ncbi:MAG TPA: thiamine pyrophosphate-dependent enzyme, partial [Chitinophagaceae bacterium]|nr:thiamine pyrophosphate-dependent enzyme [Chitinophagaceae bacterium]